jgi:isopenicillin-N epimerase
VNALTKIAKDAGLMVLIDGAHAPGVIPIDVAAIGADYYTGNLHKWCFSPKGAAFLWCNPKIVTAFHPQPTVVSSTGLYDFVGRYAYTGTRDYTAFYAVIDAFDFINNKLGGFNKMQNYNKSLLTLGCDILISEWNTSLLVPASMTAFMSNVILPVQNNEHCSILQKRLFDENKISMIYGHVVAPDDTKIYYTRISAQCYLSLNDFILLASNVKRISLELQS